MPKHQKNFEKIFQRYDREVSENICILVREPSKVLELARNTYTPRNLLFISAKIDSPQNFDPKTNRRITVNEIIDTNLLQYAKGPYGSEDKEVGCLCCKGSLHLDGIVF